MQLSIAPLMGYTNPQFIRFYSGLLPNYRFFSEMLHANAVLNGDQWHAYAALPVQPVIQLGGSDPRMLEQAVCRLKEQGLNQVNFNLGCPSPRVQKGAFGACLMKEPKLVVECLEAMCRHAQVSLKCRIGVDAIDSDQALYDFLSPIAQLDIQDWYVHARIAILQGLTPKQNREIPLLNYARVAFIKQCFPPINVHLNGQVEPELAQLKQLDFAGYMFGRMSYQQPRKLLALQLVHHDCLVPNFQDYTMHYLDQLLSSEMTPSAWRLALSPIAFWTKGEKHGRQLRQQIMMVDSSIACQSLIKVLNSY